MKVGRTALLLVPLALLSRGVAFLVPVAVARWFGVGSATDAWFWALSFPTFLLVLASTAVGTASLPAIAAAHAEDKGRLEPLLGGLLVRAGLGALAVGLGIAALGPVLLPILTNFDFQTQSLARDFLWALVPFMGLTCMSAVLRVTCEVLGRFQAVALTPLLRAGVVIALMGALRGTISAYALPVGLAAGELAQLLLWAAIARRSGIRLRPTLGLDPAVRQVGRDLALILGGEVLVALNLVIDKGFAAALPLGSVATLEYADRARVIPQTLLESSLLMVAFATWSNLRAAGRHEEARASMGAALRWTLALAAPVLAGMYIGRVVLVRLMFERGAFLPADTQATAAVLAWFIPGILPNLLGILAVRAHVVERNLRLVFSLGAVSVALNSTGNMLLMGPMGLPGLALATTLTNLVVPAIYLWHLRGKIGGEGGFAAPVALALLAAGVAAAVELGPGAPQTLWSPVLAVSAVLCLALLGLGLRIAGFRR